MAALLSCWTRLHVFLEEVMDEFEQPEMKITAVARSKAPEIFQPPYQDAYLGLGGRWEKVDELFAALDWCRANGNPHLKDGDDDT